MAVFNHPIFRAVFVLVGCGLALDSAYNQSLGWAVFHLLIAVLYAVLLGHVLTTKESLS